MLSPDPARRIAIVGAGQAACELAFALRQEGHQGPIVVLGAEDHPPYHRPPLSKAFLGGDAPRASLSIRPAEAYRKAGIELRLSTTVTRLDRERRTLTLADGATLGYDALALATGGRPRPLPVPGGEHAHLLRGIADVERLHAGFVAGRRLVIVGAGYVGLEVAAVALRKGLQVSVIESAPRVLARVFTPLLSTFYERLHREAGVHLRTGVNVVAIERRDTGLDVHLSDGSAMFADMVLAGIGLVPATELAAAAGLAVADGIVVDEHARTSDPAIVAIGDCANHPNAFAGRRLRLESVQNATEQARTAAATLCGKTRPYQVVPWFWSDQFGLKLQMVGLPQAGDTPVLRGAIEARSFICFHLRDGRLVAADAVNRPADFMHARRLIAAGRTPTRDELADPAWSLAAAAPASS